MGNLSSQMMWKKLGEQSRNLRPRLSTPLHPLGPSYRSYKIFVAFAHHLRWQGPTWTKGVNYEVAECEIDVFWALALTLWLRMNESEVRFMSVGKECDNPAFARIHALTINIGFQNQVPPTAEYFF